MKDLPKELQDKFDEAATSGRPILVGDIVVCDWCSEDYTTSPETGGFIFQSKATCPRCAPKMLAAAEKYDELHFIRARCPEGVSFADFVRELRGPDAAITVRGWPL